MKKVFMIDGGAGRVIASMPALERYINENPQDDVKIFVYGWDSLFWSNKTLQNKTFNANDKGVFQNYIKNADVIISPEPYRLPDYINQKCSLIEAFDILINHSNSNLSLSKIYLNKSEKYQAKSIVDDVKKYQQKEKTIIIQPFGSTAYFYTDNGKEDDVIDITSRSFNLLMYSKMVYNLSKNYNIILFADQKFHFKEDNFSYKLISDLRGFAAVIDSIDYFIGCDSVGQHMARALNKPGTVIFGSTFPKNVSYPDWFQIIDYKKEKRIYSPLRINDLDCNMADRNNEDCMNYTENEIEEICLKIIEDIESKTN